MARDLRLFYLFRLLATSYLYVPIFMLFMEERGLSFGERMALGSLYSAVVILVEVPTGVFADRIGRRQSMMLGAATMVISCLLAFEANSFAAFAVAEALAAVSMALCSGADSAYLFDLLAERGVAHQYGRRESTASAWHLMGSAIAFAGSGYLASLDLALPYLVTACVATAAMVVAMLLRDDRPRQRAAGSLPSASAVLRAWAGHMRLAVRDVGASPRLGWIIGYSAVVFVLLRATVYLYQPYLATRGLDVRDIGLVFAAVYVVASIVAHRAYQLRRRFGDDMLLWGLLGTLAVSFVLLEAVHGSWVIGLIGLQALAMGLYSPLVKPLVNREVPDSSRRATVLSVESIARRSAMGVFSLLAGFAGEQWSLYLCGIVGVVGFVVLAAAQQRPTPATAAAPTARALD
jgi:MFS family permease